MIQFLWGTLYLHSCSDESVLKKFLIPELMDYLESDEESAAKADDIASGTAILDTEDMETGSSAPPEAS
jgi:hypothetical protein